jgi:hypothetical protein
MYGSAKHTQEEANDKPSVFWSMSRCRQFEDSRSIFDDVDA